jgi:hypothetical protein
MPQPDFNFCGQRRNKSNPWFKRRTLFRSAVDVLRRAETRQLFCNAFDLDAPPFKNWPL